MAGQNQNKENKERVAIVLFNLGGPTDEEAIRPFLFNFFTDYNVIRLPAFLRYPLAWLIAKLRSKREAGEAYGEMGSKSPLLENTIDQARALDTSLANLDPKSEYQTFVCMRYWHPFSADVALQVKSFDPDHIVLLPLYPQYSTTTTRSSVQEWLEVCEDINLHTPTSMICCYPRFDDFIQASAKNCREIYLKAKRDTADMDCGPPRMLFSAHGLPTSYITDGDPYQWQCEETARLIAEAMEIDNLDWRVCYQSQVGPQEWIGPKTEDEIETGAADHDNVPIIVYPHAFVSEHVETIVELGIEYREEAEEFGVPYYDTVETVGTDPQFIDGLAKLVRDHDRDRGMTTDEGGRICAKKHIRCCQSSGFNFPGVGKIEFLSADVGDQVSVQENQDDGPSPSQDKKVA